MDFTPVSSLGNIKIPRGYNQSKSFAPQTVLWNGNKVRLVLKADPSGWYQLGKVLLGLLACIFTLGFAALSDDVLHLFDWELKSKFYGIVIPPGDDIDTDDSDKSDEELDDTASVSSESASEIGSERGTEEFDLLPIEDNLKKDETTDVVPPIPPEDQAWKRTWDDISLSPPRTPTKSSVEWEVQSKGDDNPVFGQLRSNLQRDDRGWPKPSIPKAADNGCIYAAFFQSFQNTAMQQSDVQEQISPESVDNNGVTQLNYPDETEYDHSIGSDADCLDDPLKSPESFSDTDSTTNEETSQGWVSWFLDRD